MNFTQTTACYVWKCGCVMDPMGRYTKICALHTTLTHRTPKP